MVLSYCLVFVRFILLVISLILVYKNKLKACIWVISITFALYCLSHWNAFFTFFIYLAKNL